MSDRSVRGSCKQEPIILHGVRILYIFMNKWIDSRLTKFWKNITSLMMTFSKEQVVLGPRNASLI